jgi:uncharacterized protein YndB with AHSA1/START domain
MTTTNKPARHRLVVSLPSDLEIRMERLFAAPRELVWKANTEAQHLEKWWGQGHTMIIDKLDLRVGGAWRFIQRMPDGTEYAFRGEFKVVTPPEVLAFTFEFELMAGHVLLQTLRFEDVQGGTKIIAVASFDSKADRDGMLKSGMEAGATESYERLEELLEQLS